jgi:hypothetical protein
MPKNERDRKKSVEMDSRLRVGDARRGPGDPGPELPLVTIAWRALRAEHQRRAADRRARDEETARLEAAAVAVSDECFRVRRALAAAEAAGAAGVPVAALRSTVARLEAALADLGVRVVAPEGQAYTGELPSLLDNEAQRRGAGAAPVVGEVLVPAVLRGERLLRGGKAVIELPAEGAKDAVTDFGFES